jgi:hypothetical protein
VDRAAVPKAAIDKNDDAVPRECDVRAAGMTGPQSIAVAHIPQCFAQQELGQRVAIPNARHLL